MRKTHDPSCARRVVLATALVALALLAPVSGCTPNKKPDFMSPSFDAQAIDRLAVLPVVDHRIDQSNELNLDRSVLRIAERSLKRRKYTYTVHRDQTLVSAITRDVLEQPDAVFVRALHPGSGRWVLLLVLEDSHSKLTFGSTGHAELSGYVFDKESGEVIWRNKELGRAGQGGLAGMAMKGMMESAALEQATTRMFHALPRRR